VGQPPAALGVASSYQTRWWLAGVRQVVPWLRERCLSTVWSALQDAGVRWRRGRPHVHSPDWLYSATVQRLATITWYSRQAPQRLVRLYQDEVTYYRRPTLGYAYTRVADQSQPLAEQGPHANTARRIAGCLDAATGALHAWQRAHFDHETLLHFYQDVEAAYPQADQLFLLQDNWPVHRQRELLAALGGSKFTVVFLPTYSPWLNPIEKVWRKLYQEVLHLHRRAAQWDMLQANVQTWLDQHQAPSTALLRYCGLLCPD
jgi:transposase